MTGENLSGVTFRASFKRGIIGPIHAQPEQARWQKIESMAF